MKVIKRLDKHFEGTLLSISLVMMTVILVAQIIMRYFFKSSLTWAEELSCILLVWSGFLSISYTLRTNTAMRLTMLLSYLPRLGRNAVLLAAQIIMLVFFGCMSVAAVGLLFFTYQSTPALGLPMEYLYVSVLLGFALTVVRAAQNIVRIVRNFKTGDEMTWNPAEAEKGE